MSLIVGELLRTHTFKITKGRAAAMLIRAGLVSHEEFQQMATAGQEAEEDFKNQMNTREELKRVVFDMEGYIESCDEVAVEIVTGFMNSVVERAINIGQDDNEEPAGAGAGAGPKKTRARKKTRTRKKTKARKASKAADSGPPDEPAGAEDPDEEVPARAEDPDEEVPAGAGAEARKKTKARKKTSAADPGSPDEPAGGAEEEDDEDDEGPIANGYVLFTLDR